MEIGKFNQMKAYLLKPKRLFTKKQDTIGGGTIQGEDLGSRSGFQEPYAVQKIKRGGKEFERVYTKKPGKPKTFDFDDKAIADWRKSLTKKDPLPWSKFLEKKYGEKGGTVIRKRVEDDKSFNPKQEYRTKIKENRINIIKKLYDEHQKSDKFLYDQQAIGDILGITINRKDHPEELKLIDTFDNREDKIRNAFDKIVNGNMKLYKAKKTAASNKTQNVIINMISDMVSNPELSARYSTEGRVINKALENYKPYLDIKDDFDYFAQNEASNFIGKNFQEGLEYAKYKRGGLDIRNTSNYSKVYALPEQNILNFAIRNAYLNFKNDGKPDVKLFYLNKDGSKGKPVDFNDLPRDQNSKKITRILDANKIGFEYQGQFFNKNTIRTEGFNSGLFDEVYEMSKKGRLPVPDPNNPGQEIPLKQLLEDTGDKLTIGHNDAKGGVAGDPFNDLRIESAKFNVALFNAYKNVENPQARKLIINKLQGTFGHLKGDKYEQAFIDDKSKLAKRLFENPTDIIEPTYYRAAGQEVLQDLGKDFFKKSKDFQTDIARVAGINLEDYAANRNRFRKYLMEQFCGLGGARSVNALGGRIGFAEGPQVCSADTVAKGMQKSIQAGDSAKVLGALKQGTKLLGKVVAPIDVAIEGAFALPYLLEGDLEGAKQATTLGFFGWGKDLQEQVGDRFGENSPAFGALEKQRAIDLQVEGVFDMDQALLRGEKAGIFIKDEKGDYKQRKDLTVADQDSLKLANNLFKTGAEKTLEARNLFANAAPKILGPQNESTALSQLGVFSDEVRSGALNEKIGDPSKIANLFKSLNISQPADQNTIEGYLSTLGGQTEFPLASNVKQSELVQDQLNRLKELRIADLPLDIAAQVPAYEKAQLPSEEELEKRLRMNLGIADPQLVQQYEQMGFPQLVPFLPSYANGGRIGLKEGLTPEQQGPMGPVFTTSDPKEAAKEVMRRAIKIQDADIPVSEKLKISLQGLDNVTLQGVMKILGGELSFGAGKQGSDKGMGFSFYKQFANGGRIKYAEGPPDPSKRKFLKNVGIGGGIVGGFMTGLLNLVDLFKGGKKGVVATKAAESEAEKIFLDLVNVVKNKGILKRLDDPSELKQGEIYEYKGVKVLEDGENIEVRFETDKGAPAMVEYRKPGYEVDPDAGTSVPVPGEFIGEGQEVYRIGGDNYYKDIEEEIIDPIENIKKIADE